MRLGLIGYPVKHSLSPVLYKEILGSKLESYDLLSYEIPAQIPSLQELAPKYDGINITSPYKQHFVTQIIIESSLVKSINAVNTLAFTDKGIIGTNTDLLAVKMILEDYKKKFGKIHLILLGSGVMARLTEIVAQSLSVSLTSLSRKTNPELAKLDLRKFRQPQCQNIIVNSCSRDFIFLGITSMEDLFWDYNYAFSPHISSIPSKVKSYEDGQVMLKLQAQAAVNFWYETNPKLKC